MRVWEITEQYGGISEPIDFNPQVTRHLFDLDVAANGGKMTPKQEREFRSFLYQNRQNFIRMYHATSVDHDVMRKGLLPTSARRARSLQSGHGYVYVSYDPMRALSFARFAYPQDKRFVIYSVLVPVKRLRADLDQLRNKRSYGGQSDIQDNLPHSLIYGGGARIRGRVDPMQLSVYGYFDKDGRRLPD